MTLHKQGGLFFSGQAPKVTKGTSWVSLLVRQTKEIFASPSSADSKAYAQAFIEPELAGCLWRNDCFIGAEVCAASLMAGPRVASALLPG